MNRAAPVFNGGGGSGGGGTGGNTGVSDLAGVEVRASAALTAAYVATTATDCQSFQAIDWHIFCTDKTGLATLLFQVQVSVLAAPVTGTNTDWAVVQAEVIAAGVATESNYEYSKALAAETAPFSLIVTTLHTRGRWARLLVKADTADAASRCSVQAYRRAF